MIRCTSSAKIKIIAHQANITNQGNGAFPKTANPFPEAIKKDIGISARVGNFKNRVTFIAGLSKPLTKIADMKNKDRPRIIKSIIKTGHDPRSNPGSGKGKGYICKLSPNVGLINLRSLAIEVINKRARPK
jgi:hypothetical protein